MPRIEDEWSDSDDEVLSDVETSVNLGVPDGPIQAQSDIDDAAVSRIGGRPAFLPSTEPSLTSSQCKNCSNVMELLVQIYCPFEDSPMDRVLYVWGCSRAGCQGASGSVRAWRGLRYNELYAKKLEKKLVKRRKREEEAKAAREAAQKTKPITSNPFSMGGTATSDNPFSFGTQIFGNESAPQNTEEPEGGPEDKGDVVDESDEDDEESVASEESLITALASTTLDESPWNAAPSYSPLYLSTVGEYVPNVTKPKLAQSVSNVDGKDDIGNWRSETYENSLDVDQVFDRFVKRVEHESKQCIRYELDGVPLPYATDGVFQKLFPSPPAAPLPVTKPDFKVVPNAKRTYTPAIPDCPHCKSKRVFECQLMPNLINVLRPSQGEKEEKKMSDEERRKYVQSVVKGGGTGTPGMSWGTCMIFSCNDDCCEGKEGWREEVVLVQWDT